MTIGIHSHLLAYRLSCMYSHTLLMVSLYSKIFSAHTLIGDGKLYTLEPLYNGPLNSGHLSITYTCCCPSQKAI